MEFNKLHRSAKNGIEKAADLGNKDAMNSLGDMYADGLGVYKSFVKAQEWYTKAKM